MVAWGMVYELIVTAEGIACNFCELVFSVSSQDLSNPFFGDAKTNLSIEWDMIFDVYGYIVGVWLYQIRGPLVVVGPLASHPL